MNLLKWPNRRIAGLFFFFFVLVIFVSDLVYAGPNLLPSTNDDRWHYGFETSALGVDDLCWEENWGGVTNNTSIDGYETIYQGTRSCRFVDLTTAYSGREVASQFVGVTASRYYDTSIYAYVPTEVGAVGEVQFRLKIRWYTTNVEAAENLISEDVSEGLTLSTLDAWEKLSISDKQAPATATYARFVVAALETINNAHNPVIDDGYLGTAIDKLVFTDYDADIPVNTKSDVFTVQTQDADSAAYSVGIATTINLSSTSTGSYSFDDCSDTWSITSITITSGTCYSSFYYKDNTVGTPTITAAESPSEGWTDATQQVTISSANTAPTVSFNATPSQSTAGDGKVTVNVEIDDADDDDTCKLKVEYSTDGSTWKDPTIESGTITADFGTPALDNTATYQIGTSSGWILTSSGSNTITFVWLSATDEATTYDTTVYIKVTVHDGTENCTTPPTSSAFTVDNVAPTVPTAIHFEANPTSGDTTFQLDAAFTETNPNTNVYGYKLNTADYSLWDGDTNVADPTPKTITPASALDGDDYFDGTKCTHTDDYGNATTSEDYTVTYKYVIPLAPLAPTVDNPTVSTVDVTVNPNASEVTTVKYAIHETSTGNYVQAPNASGNATLGVSAVWQVIGISAGQWGYGKTSGKVTVTGLSENTQYTFEVKATNPNDTGTTVSAYGTSASKYTLLDPPTDGELTIDAATSTTQLSMSVSAPPNSTSGFTGCTFDNITGSGAGGTDSGNQTGTYTYTDTGLNANTQYGYKVRYINGDGTATAYNTTEKTKYTLSVAPTTSTVTCDKSVTTWYNTSTFTFSAVGGFGAGTVQYYSRYWDQSATHTWVGTESAWTTGTRPETAAEANNNYFHVKGFNAEDVANGTLDLGAYYYDGTAPTTITGLAASNPTSSSIYLTWTPYGTDGGLSGYSTYEIFYSTSSPVDTTCLLWDATDETALSLYNTASATVGSLSSAITYYFKIRGKDKAGNEGTLSSEVNETTQGASTDIKINEVMANSIDDELGEDGDEWVELYNKGTGSVNIDGWELVDKGGEVFTINASLESVPSGGYVVCHFTSDASNVDDYSFTGDNVAHLYWNSDDALVEAGDCLGLYTSSTHDSTTIVDFVAWEADMSAALATQHAVTAGIWPALTTYYDYTAGADRSIYLHPDGDDNNLTTDWGYTAGDGRASEGGTNDGMTTAVTTIDYLKFVDSGWSTEATEVALGGTLYIKLTRGSGDTDDIDYVQVKVYGGTTDTTGIMVTLKETLVNSNEFHGTATVSATASNSSMDHIKAVAGETLYVEDLEGPVPPTYDQQDTITVAGGVTTISITNWRELY